MEDDAKKSLACVLKRIKIKSDMAAYNPTDDLKMKKEKGYIESPESTNYSIHPFSIGKRVALHKNDLADCDIHFETDLKNALAKLKELKAIVRFEFNNQGAENFYEILLPDYFNNLFSKDGDIILFGKPAIKIRNTKYSEINSHKYQTGGEIKREIYKYSDNGLGTLRISGCPEIIFTKIPAIILDFFYRAIESSKDYKIYRDFNKFYAENNHTKIIGSDSFSKKIKAINRRVDRETSGLIKEIIEKKSDKKNRANFYKWNENAR